MDVTHSVPVWLERTNTWIFNHLTHLPSHINNRVVCDWTANLDQFDAEGIAVRAAFSSGSSWRFRFQAALRKMRLTNSLLSTQALLEKTPGNILHSHWGNTGWQNLKFCRRTGIKHLVQFYGYDMSLLPRQRVWRRRYLELFSEVDQVVCEGPHMARVLHQLGCPNSRLTVMPLGIDLSRIEFRPLDWRQGEALKILISSTFREKKGIPYGLEALAIFGRKHPVNLTIIGGATGLGRDRAEEQRIERALNRASKNIRIERLGSLPYERYLEQAHRHHILLAPSVYSQDGDSEGGAPVTLIEMMAAGMLVLATNHADIPNTLPSAYSDLLAPERNVDALVRSLDFISDNPGIWDGLRQASRRRAEMHYDVRYQSRVLAGVYRKLLD